MKTIALALGTAVAAVAMPASAQVYIERSYTYDPYWSARAGYLDSRHECWNPRAGHFEQVRPGDYQDDLDFGRCRLIGGRYYPSRTYRTGREECWNPRAGHYEEVRRGDYQPDLDFGQCRVVADDVVTYRRYAWR